MKKVRLAAFSVSLVGILSACSGGGGDGGGGGGGTTTSIYPRFAYVANTGDNTLSVYAVNATTGQLRANGYVATGTTPTTVELDPANKFAYVTNSVDNTVSSYKVDAATGALAGAGTAPTGQNPQSFTIDPTGKFAYVANWNSGDVSAYTIDSTTGALTVVSGSPFAAGSSPTATTVDPTGKFAYVANWNSANISAYTINATTGVLTPIAGSPFPAGTAPGSVTLDPAGKFAYVANWASGTVTAYAINATTGALTQVAGSPFTAGTNPRTVAVDSSGKFAYVTNQGSNDVSVYTINSTSGALTSVGTVPAGTAPYTVTVDPSDKFVYVTNMTSNDIYSYSIDGTTGALTKIGAVAARKTVRPIAITKGTTPVNYVAKYAYVANYGSDSVTQYTVGANGGLAQMATAVVSTGSGSHPCAVAVDPTGKYAYVANSTTSNGCLFMTPLGTYHGSVGQYAIGANGALTPIAADMAAGTSPVSVTVDPSGRYVYAANFLSNDISAYSINPASGALTQISCVASGSSGCSSVNNMNFGLPQGITGGAAFPSSIGVDPSGQYVYVTVFALPDSAGSGGVLQYTIGANGALTPMSVAYVGFTGGGHTPASLTFDPSGRQAYLSDAFTYGTNIGVLNIDPITGQLSVGSMFLSSTWTGANIAVDPTGRYIYETIANSIFEFALTGDPVTPLTKIADLGFVPGLYGLAVDPSGRYVYATNTDGSTVSTYAIGANGTLTSVGAPVAAQTTPVSIAIAGIIQ